MPAIKVYKGNKSLIPVDVAKVAKAYQCPWTDEIFATKKGYVKHLQDLRTTRMHRRARQNVWNRKFADFYNQPTFDKVIDWIHTNPEFFFDRAKGLAFSHRQKDLEKVRSEFWVKITYLDINYSERLSNSHSCPRNGVTNWGRRDTYKDGSPKPEGYPGFGGRIEFQLSHDIGFGSDVFRGLGINTGTGGGTGEHRYGFDVKLFLDDWPGIKAKIEQDREEYEKKSLLDMINNQYKSFHIPGFKYGTPRYFRR